MQAYSSLENKSYVNFLHHYGVDIKNDEAGDLSHLVSVLYPLGNNGIFNGFYVGYKIPQIGKEFDLLRIGKEYIVNVELKRTSSEEKIQKQLYRNKYYLTSIGKPVYNFSFISDTKKLYFLHDSNGIQWIDFSYLKQVLENQIIDNIDNIDKLFNPSIYLVSPFNSTDNFVRDEYFLTHQQEEIKGKVLNTVVSTPQSGFVSITGSAGTGKTLLVYDIAKEIIKTQKKVLIIHCGYLNDGQEKLKTQYKWEIISIKYYANYNLSLYNMVIIDEAQRIYPEQLKKIVSTIQAANGKCIFSYDKVQTLANWEEQRDIDGHINNINSITAYKLTDKIRTNREIASFIRALFDKKKNLPHNNEGNIELNYFNSINDAKCFLESMSSQDWEVLRFTPSQYNNEHHENYSSILNKTSHGIIGQEFDNVAVVIDQFFSYSQNGKLIYAGGAYYHPVKMLFQNITRTRKKLNIVIINNSEILNRCISIM